MRYYVEEHVAMRHGKMTQIKGHYRTWRGDKPMGDPVATPAAQARAICYCPHCGCQLSKVRGATRMFRLTVKFCPSCGLDLSSVQVRA
jgi:hypothetical protein